MDIAARHGYQEASRDERATAGGVAIGSSTTGSLVGAVAIVLIIVALAGVSSVVLLSIATIFIGVELVLEGGAFSSRVSTLITSEMVKVRSDVSESGGGISAELVAGIVGIILGVLALIGVAPLTLIPITAVIFGASLIISSAATSRINTEFMSNLEERRAMPVGESINPSAGVQALFGFIAIVLGILAILNLVPLTMSIAAMLVVGVLDFLSGNVVGGRFLSIFRHT